MILRVHAVRENARAREVAKPQRRFLSVEAVRVGMALALVDERPRSRAICSRIGGEMGSG